jgi:hypothetical protein
LLIKFLGFTIFLSFTSPSQPSLLFSPASLPHRRRQDWAARVLDILWACHFSGQLQRQMLQAARSRFGESPGDTNRDKDG